MSNMTDIVRLLLMFTVMMALMHVAAGMVTDYIFSETAKYEYGGMYLLHIIYYLICQYDSIAPTCITRTRMQ